MVRLGYIGLSVLMAFVPLTFYWSMHPSRNEAVTTSRYYSSHHHHHYGGYWYYGGGHGGWFGNTYSWGRGDDRYDRVGGASAHRGGGPGAGGK